MTIVFWTCVAAVLYVYFGYPLLLMSGALGRRGTILRKQQRPFVSIIVPARNEEKNIRGKLENLLLLDHPMDRLEILVGNDASTDETGRLVREFRHPAVQLIESPVRRGKSAVQNALVARARGDTLAFTDADCLLPADSLPKLLENLHDPSVGLATNSVEFTNRRESTVVENEGLYWRYEKWLRLQESERGLLGMASGSLFVMRRELWRPLDPNLGDDFVLPLEVIRSGFRNVLDPRVSARTPLGQSNPQSMFRMKSRIISKDFRGLLRFKDCLNPLRTGAVAVGLLSHKLLRWAVPYFMVGALLTNLFLLKDHTYMIFFWLQVIFYTLAATGFLLLMRRIRSPLSILTSLCLVNLAALFGTMSCLWRRPAGQWETVR